MIETVETPAPKKPKKERRIRTEEERFAERLAYLDDLISRLESKTRSAREKRRALVERERANAAARFKRVEEIAAPHASVPE